MEYTKSFESVFPTNQISRPFSHVPSDGPRKDWTFVDSKRPRCPPANWAISADVPCTVCSRWRRPVDRRRWRHDGHSTGRQWNRARGICLPRRYLTDTTATLHFPWTWNARGKTTGVRYNLSINHLRITMGIKVRQKGARNSQQHTQMTKRNKTINQSINQSTHSKVNKPVLQSINQSINQSKAWLSRWPTKLW